METKQRFNAKDIALIATFAALIAVSAIAPAVPIGGPVAITLQTFSVLLAGAVLGTLRSFLSVLLYLAIGAIGLPVFAGGGAGIGQFFGASAGYLVAMPFAAALTGFLVHRLTTKNTLIMTLSIAGYAALATVVVIYPLGVLGLAWRGGMDIGAAFIFNLSFVPGDMIKAALVGVVAAAIMRAFPALKSRSK